MTFGQIVALLLLVGGFIAMFVVVAYIVSIVLGSFGLIREIRELQKERKSKDDGE